MNAKKTFILLIVIFLVPSTLVKAETHIHNLNFITGTQLNLIGTLDSTNLKTGTNKIYFSLVYTDDLGGTFILYDIHIDVRIHGEIVASYDFDDLYPAYAQTEFGIQNVTLKFQYNRDLGESRIDVKYYMKEDRISDSDWSYETDWVAFFNVGPVTFMQDFYLYFVGGGIFLLSIIFAITMYFLRKRKPPKKDTSSDSYIEITAQEDSTLSIETVMYCDNCGSKSKAENKFCKKCGSKLVQLS